MIFLNETIFDRITLEQLEKMDTKSTMITTNNVAHANVIGLFWLAV